MILGVVELGEAVGDLAAADEELEALGDEGVVVLAARQRRHLGGVIGDEGRVLEAMLDGLLEDLDLHLAQAPAVFYGNAQPFGDAAGALLVRQGGGVDVVVVLQDGIEHRQPRERLAEVVDVILVGNLGGAQHVLRQGAQHVLGEVHQVVVIRVGLVELQHGEFRVVPGAEALVAEVAVDLEHPLEAAHHQTLEVQFRRDAQVHVQVQTVVVGDERPRRGAAGDHLQHRRFRFHETVAHQVIADAGHHL